MAEWVTIGIDVFGDAQKRLGLSDERAARLVPVSVRTWIRWRQRGQVPVHSLDRVAQILELEIERPAGRRSVHVDEDRVHVDEDRDADLVRHDEIITRLDAIEEQLRALALVAERR